MNVMEDNPYSSTGKVKQQQGEWKKGVPQGGGCKDTIWGILFYVHLAGLLVVLGLFGSSMEKPSSDSVTMGYAYELVLCALFAFLFFGLGIIVMIASAEFLIKASLYFTVGMSLLWSILGFASGQILMGFMFLLTFAFGVCYINAVWSRIPFATVNLVTSLTAIKSNFGIVFVAYWMTILGAMFSAVWSLAMAGLYNEICGDGGCDEENDSFPTGLGFAMFVSYFWTLQVISNVVHVTVAGLVSTWWFTPSDANGCCSGAIHGSFCRSVTTSFGSICLGSLLVAIIQALRQIAEQGRQNDNVNGIVICIVDCILACIQNLIEVFNKWAFVYVGVYGYSYYEAGTNVMELFRARGWMAIITDDLTGNALMLVAIIVGLMTGVAGMIAASVTNWFTNSDNMENVEINVFILGTVIGFVLSAIMFSLVSSGVNTVIVCFADAPAEFQTNHPQLSNRMRSTWRTSFPGCL